MRLVTFERDSKSAVGLVRDGGVVDLTARFGISGMRELLSRGTGCAARWSDEPPDFRLDEVQLLPPVPDPVHIVGVGLNTRSHFEETAALRNRTPGDYPKYPRLFLRSAMSQAGHEQDLWVPRVSSWLDYEGELACIIGKPSRYLTSEGAMASVAGYACYNDGSVRDYQSHTDQTTGGKSFPRTGGFGPWLTTADEAPPLESLRLTTTVNGEVRQRMGMDDLIFSIPELLVYVSQIFALQPGDVLVTGSPAGSGGISRNWLKPGDRVEVEIAGVGKLTNQVAAEPGP